jgi:hypothetical protein
LTGVWGDSEVDNDLDIGGRGEGNPLGRLALCIRALGLGCVEANIRDGFNSGEFGAGGAKKVSVTHGSAADEADNGGFHGVGSLV